VPDGYWLPYWGRAEARLAVEDWDGCIADCDRALAMTQHGAVRIVRAKAVAKRGTRDEKIQALEELHRLTGSDDFRKQLEALRSGR